MSLVVSSNVPSEVQGYEKLRNQLEKLNGSVDGDNVKDFLGLCLQAGTFYENVENYVKGAAKLVAVCHDKLTSLESTGFQSEDLTNVKDHLAQLMCDYIMNHI